MFNDRTKYVANLFDLKKVRGEVFSLFGIRLGIHSCIFKNKENPFQGELKTTLIFCFKHQLQILSPISSNHCFKYSFLIYLPISLICIIVSDCTNIKTLFSILSFVVTSLFNIWHINETDPPDCTSSIFY